jgi:hypothetical protein
LTSYQTLANSDALFDVPVRDEPSPKRYKRREKVKRRKLEADDEGEEFEDSADEEQIDPEMPGGGLPKLGATKKWDVVVCDEAHRIKNISTLLGKTMRSIHANCRLLLTGTPVQNALQDLWSLMDFAQPGLLGNHATFVKHFSDPIDRGSFGGASTFQVELKKHLAEQLRTLITPHLLRRTKVNAGLMAEVGEEAGDIVVEDDGGEDGGDAQAQKLPPKRETIVWLKPTNEQLDAYKRILERSDVIREACSKSKLGFEVFRAIGLLKRLCNHPALLLTLSSPKAWRDYLADATAELQTMASANLEEASMDAAAADGLALGGGSEVAFSEDAPDDAEAGASVEETIEALGRSADAILSYSSKLRCLSSLIPSLAKRGHRTLIFCQSVKMLDLVQICCLKPKGLRCLRIDGQTDARERAEKVNKFNKQIDRFQCMLLTTHVGGVGLNLTSADRVVLVDPAWNPAIDAQAVDRAFRIGQDKEVRVYRLIMSGLIEDKMFRLQVFKMGLTKTALESDQTHRYFSQREIKALFEFTDPAVGETRKMLLDKHGDKHDADTQEAAADDGASEDGWLAAGPAVGLSDFALLYGGFAKDEEEPDKQCTAQVNAAKEQLGAADMKLSQKADAKREAEEEIQAQTTELAEVNEALESARERRCRAIEQVKERNSEAVQERRAEGASQMRMEKAQRANSSAEEKAGKAKQTSMQQDAEAEAAEKAAAESIVAVKSAEDVFMTAYSDAKNQMALVKNDGSATKNGVVEASKVVQLRSLQKAVERLQAQLQSYSNKQVEHDVSEQELLKVEHLLGQAEKEFASISEDGSSKKTAEFNAKKLRKERERAEGVQVKAKEKVEAARETTANVVQACVEAGVGFVESLQKAQDRPVKVDQVKAVLSQAKAIFRQFSAAFSASRRAREGHTKIVAAQRKAFQKAATSAAVYAEAARSLEDAQNEQKAAAEEEKQMRESVVKKEKALALAETEKIRVETLEGELKRRREELRAAVPAAKELLKAAKAAEKDAMNERQALHSKCSKVERQHLEMEEAKNSAMQTLQREKYDPTQVDKAYEKEHG